MPTKDGKEVNSEEAMNMFESGKATGVFVQTILLWDGDHYWLSFDGEEWERNDGELIKKQF